MQISNEIKKPFSGPLMDEMVFETKAELDLYLSNSLKYAGMTVSCNEDNMVYVLNSSMTEWIPSGSVIKDRNTTFNKRNKLKFEGDVLVTDDPVTKETIIAIKPNNRLVLNEVTAFSIVGGNGQATLRWSDPQDKSENGLTAVWKGTRLLRKTGSYPQNEEDGVLVITNGVRDQYKDNGFTDLNLVNGTKYYYALFPFTTLGTFTPPTISSEREVTPSDIGGYEGAVLNFTASSLNNAIGLTWTNPIDSNYKGVKIVRSRTYYPSSHTDGDRVYMGNGTSYNDLGLLAETSYHYTAFAYDNTNTFNASGAQTVGVTLPSPKLGPVQNFTATAGNGLVVLKWTDPPDVMDNGKKIVTWYGTLIRRRTDSYPQNELDGTLVVENQIFNQYKDDGFTDVGLTNDTTYYYSAFPFDINNKYTVDTSTNSRKTAKPSASLGGIPAITNLSAIPGDKSVRLRWNNPSNSQDLNKIEIRMRVDSPINSITEGVLIATYSKPVPTTHEQNELTNGRNYYFKIFEYNNYNQVRTEGNESVSVTPTSASYTESIYGFYAAPGDSNVLLSWVEPTSTEYIGVTIKFKTGSYPDGISDGYPVSNTGFFSKNTNSYSHTGLNNGTTYFYRAFTQNLQGNWNANTFGQQVEAMPVGATTYSGYPTGVTHIAGDGKVTIRWTGWSPEGGESEATGVYAVYKTDSVAPLNDSDGNKAYIGKDLSKDYVISGLSNNTLYTIKLFAYKVINPTTTIVSNIQSSESTFSFTPKAVVSAGTISSQTITTDVSYKIKLQWTEPLGDWTKTVIVRKTGSYPTSPTDSEGVVIVTNIERDKYKTIPFTDTTPGANTYYYRAFTYNGDVVNSSDLNKFNQITSVNKFVKEPPSTPVVVDNSSGIYVTVQSDVGSKIQRSPAGSEGLVTSPATFTTTPGATYTFTAYFPEDATHLASNLSAGLTLITPKAPGGTSQPPKIVYEWYNSETNTWSIGLWSNSNAIIERDRTAISIGGSWATYSEGWLWSGIVAGTTRSCIAKYIATENYLEGPSSTVLSKRLRRVKPEKPVIKFFTDNSITVGMDSVKPIDLGDTNSCSFKFQLFNSSGTLVSESSSLYSLDSIHTFNSLVPNTTYKFKIKNETTYKCTKLDGYFPDLDGTPAQTINNVLSDETSMVIPAVSAGGVRIFKNESDPTKKVSYIGSMSGASPCFFNNGTFSNPDSTSLAKLLSNMDLNIYGCVYKNGTETTILNSSNFYKDNAGNSVDLTTVDGDIMIVIPTLYWKITDEGSASFRIEVSKTPQSGFEAYAHKRPDGSIASKIYIGAYPGYVDATNKLRSSVSKSPTGGKTFDEFVTYANNNGGEILTVQTVTMLQIIFLMLFKSTNSQKVFGVGRKTPTTTGGTAIMGAGFTAAINNSSMSFFGIEDLWEHMGYFVNNVITAQGTGGFNGVIVSYGKNPSMSPGVGTILNIPSSILNGGYVKGMEAPSSSGFPLTPTAYGGTDNTYWCDYSSYSSVNGYHLVFAGDGCSYYSEFNGIFSMQFMANSSFKGATYGARLQFREGV